MDTSTITDTVVMVASSGIDWSYWLHRLIVLISDPLTFAYLASIVAGGIGMVRMKLNDKQKRILDASVYAFGKVEKAYDMLPAAKKAKYKKEVEFVSAVVDSYEARDGAALSKKDLTAALQVAAKLAFQKKTALPQ